jgi:hypothetical protein
MNSELYLIEYNNNIIGVYSNYNLAEIFILSCLQNNLILNDAKIITYKCNSGYIINNTVIKNNLDNLESTKVNDNKIINELELANLNEKKKKLNNHINIINYNKKKLNEYKTLYELDKILFHKFENLLNTDQSFIIPCLFEDKFKIYKKLNIDNNLNFDSFIDEFYNGNFYNDTDIFLNDNYSNDENKSISSEDIEIDSISNSSDK